MNWPQFLPSRICISSGNHTSCAETDPGFDSYRDSNTSEKIWRTEPRKPKYRRPHSDSLDFVEAYLHQCEGLETDFNGGIVPTDEVRGRIHLAVEIGSVTLDALYDPGSTRTFVRNKMGKRILDSTAKELDRSRRSMKFVANGSMQVIEEKLKLPLTIEEVIQLCEVRFAEHLDTKMIFGLDATHLATHHIRRFEERCLSDTLYVGHPEAIEGVKMCFVLDKITQANLTVNPEMCEFCHSEVKYLGYVANRDGFSVNPEKTEPIFTYPVP